MELRPGPGANALMYSVACAMAIPLAIFVSGFFEPSDVVSRADFLRSFLICLPLSLFVASRSVRYTKITVTANTLSARFTRYCVKRQLDIEFASISSVRLLSGLYGFDGRPRPLVEIEFKSGGTCWVPLSAYTRTAVLSVVDAIRRGGVTVHEGPRTLHR